MFTYSFGDVVLPIGLILPFSEVKISWQKDKDLDLHWLQESLQKKAMFISLRSVCWGAFIVPEFIKDTDFLVVDVVSTDMFLWIQAIYPPQSPS
jgi:hypothetical protein